MVDAIFVDSLGAPGYFRFTFSQSYFGLTEHSKKTPKNTKHWYFAKKSVFSAQKRSIGCRYFAKK